MQISDVTQLPTVINRATTWENALLLLSYQNFELQNSYNNTVPDSEQKNFISIIKTLESTSNPYVEISLSNIEINFVNGSMNTFSTLTPDNFIPRDIFPWNSRNSLECLVNMFIKTFEFEQSTVTNPQSEEILTVDMTQNTQFNSSMFTLSANITLPIEVSKSEGKINYSIVEYLEGSFPI